MRALLYFFIFVAVVLFIGYKTCPEKRVHVERISSVVSVAVQTEAEERGVLATAAAANAVLSTDLVTASIGKLLIIEDYGFFSLGKIIWNEKEYYLSLGAMNTVFCFSSEMLQEKLDEIIE